MSRPLSTDDLDRLATAFRVLATPAEPAAAWRVAVHRELRSLLEADELTLLLPIPGASPWYHPDLPTECADQRVAELAAADPVTPRVVARVGGGQAAPAWTVVESGTLFAADSLLLLRLSAGGAEAGRLWFAFGDGDPAAMARRAALLRAVVPALLAGLAALRRPAGPDRDEVLGRLLDCIESPLFLYEPEARAVRTNPALERLLATAADGLRLRRDLEGLARTISCRPTPRGREPGQPTPPHELRVGEQVYLVRGTVLDRPGACDTLCDTLVLAVEPAPAARPLSDEVLRTQYGLTGREVQVARLLASGQTNREIARALGIRPATARNHAERVRQKLSVRTRSRVAATLCGVAA